MSDEKQITESAAEPRQWTTEQIAKIKSRAIEYAGSTSCFRRGVTAEEVVALAEYAEKQILRATPLEAVPVSQPSTEAVAKQLMLTLAAHGLLTNTGAAGIDVEAQVVRDIRAALTPGRTR